MVVVPHGKYQCFIAVIAVRNISNVVGAALGSVFIDFILIQTKFTSIITK